MNRKGQFPIVLALALSAILIVSALIAYKITVFPTKAEQRKWTHVILNAEEDLQRILKAALANFTQEYVDTGNLTFSESKAEVKLKTWKLAFIIGYMDLSVKLNLDSDDVVIRSSSSHSVNVTYNGNATQKIFSVPSVLIGAGHFFNCSWDTPSGVSAAYASVTLDATQHMVYGWNSSSTILLTLNITSINSDSSLNETRIEFKCSDEDGWVNQLSAENITVYVNGTMIGLQDLDYEGEGSYMVTIGYALSRPYTLTLSVIDSRGIVVRASLQD